MRVVITCRQLARDLDVVQSVFDQLEIEISCPPVVQHLAGDELVAALDGAVGVIAGDDLLTEEVMSRCPDLRAIAKWGIGVDGIDLDAARRRGIAVTNTPNAFDDEVADVTIAYLVTMTRQLHAVDRGVRAGGWPKPLGTSLAGRTVGIVGLGGIGRAVARRAAAMGMTVIGTDPSPESRQLAEALGVQALPLPELLERSLAVTLSCPLTPDTFHLMDTSAFGHLRPGSYLVNTARGAVVDETALVDALRSGILAGAALDVFEDEPLHPESPLRQFDQVVFGSHNASNTHEAGQRTHWRAVSNLVESLGLVMP